MSKPWDRYPSKQTAHLCCSSAFCYSMWDFSVSRAENHCPSCGNVVVLNNNGRKWLRRNNPAWLAAYDFNRGYTPRAPVVVPPTPVAPKTPEEVAASKDVPSIDTIYAYCGGVGCKGCLSFPRSLKDPEYTTCSKCKQPFFPTAKGRVWLAEQEPKSEVPAVLTPEQVVANKEKSLGENNAAYCTNETCTVHVSMPENLEAYPNCTRCGAPYLPTAKGRAWLDAQKAKEVPVPAPATPAELTPQEVVDAKHAKAIKDGVHSATRVAECTNPSCSQGLGNMESLSNPSFYKCACRGLFLPTPLGRRALGPEKLARREEAMKIETWTKAVADKERQLPSACVVCDHPKCPWWGSESFLKDQIDKPCVCEFKGTRRVTARGKRVLTERAVAAKDAEAKKAAELVQKKKDEEARLKALDDTPLANPTIEQLDALAARWKPTRGDYQLVCTKPSCGNGTNPGGAIHEGRFSEKCGTCRWGQLLPTTPALEVLRRLRVDGATWIENYPDLVRLLGGPKALPTPDRTPVESPTPEQAATMACPESRGGAFAVCNVPGCGNHFNGLDNRTLFESGCNGTWPVSKERDHTGIAGQFHLTPKGVEALKALVQAGSVWPLKIPHLIRHIGPIENPNPEQIAALDKARGYFAVCNVPTCTNGLDTTGNFVERHFREGCQPGCTGSFHPTDKGEARLIELRDKGETWHLQFPRLAALAPALPKPLATLTPADIERLDHGRGFAGVCNVPGCTNGMQAGALTEYNFKQGCGSTSHAPVRGAWTVTPKGAEALAALRHAGDSWWQNHPFLVEALIRHDEADKDCGPLEREVRKVLTTKMHFPCVAGCTRPGCGGNTAVTVKASYPCHMAGCRGRIMTLAQAQEEDRAAKVLESGVRIPGPREAKVLEVIAYTHKMYGGDKAIAGCSNPSKPDCRVFVSKGNTSDHANGKTLCVGCKAAFYLTPEQARAMDEQEAAKPAEEIKTMPEPPKGPRRGTPEEVAAKFAASPRSKCLCDNPECDRTELNPGCVGQVCMRCKVGVLVLRPEALPEPVKPEEPSKKTPEQFRAHYQRILASSAVSPVGICDHENCPQWCSIPSTLGTTCSRCNMGKFQNAVPYGGPPALPEEVPEAPPKPAPNPIPDEEFDRLCAGDRSDVFRCNEKGCKNWESGLARKGTTCPKCKLGTLTKPVFRPATPEQMTTKFARDAAILSACNHANCEGRGKRKNAGEMCVICKLGHLVPRPAELEQPKSDPVPPEPAPKSPASIEPTTTPKEIPTMTTNQTTENADVTMTTKILAAAKETAKEASWRIAATQLAKTVREPLAAAVARSMGAENVYTDDVVKFLKSPAGDAMCRMLLGVAIDMVPFDARVKAGLAHELRVSSMEKAGELVADVLVDPILKVLTEAIRGNPALIEDMNRAAGVLPEPASTAHIDFGSGNVTPIRESVPAAKKTGE